MCVCVVLNLGLRHDSSCCGILNCSYTISLSLESYLSKLNAEAPTSRPAQPPIQWVPGVSREKSGKGLALTIHSHLKPRLKKE